MRTSLHLDNGCKNDQDEANLLYPTRARETGTTASYQTPVTVRRAFADKLQLQYAELISLTKQSMVKTREVQ